MLVVKNLVYFTVVDYKIRYNSFKKPPGSFEITCSLKLNYKHIYLGEVETCKSPLTLDV